MAAVSTTSLTGSLRQDLSTASNTSSRYQSSSRPTSKRSGRDVPSSRTPVAATPTTQTRLPEGFSQPSTSRTELQPRPAAPESLARASSNSAQGRGSPASQSSLIFERPSTSSLDTPFQQLSLRHLDENSDSGTFGGSRVSGATAPGKASRFTRTSSDSSTNSSVSTLLSPASQSGHKWSSQTSIASDQSASSASQATKAASKAQAQQGVRQPRKMHQTSSRLLRMTDDDRPFTKDFKDLFATLIVSLLPLSAHRVRLTKVEHTFLSEDAINNLGSLKFSQSNRMPDPKDPSRIVTTTTTTTFSMAKDMARSICQRFVEARYIESADGKYLAQYPMKGAVWQLTPKGISLLDRFCSRNGIQQKQVAELTAIALPQLVSLERDGATDVLTTDKSTLEVIFRRFVGVNGMNSKTSVSQADSESLSDYRDGMTGVKMASERKLSGKLYRDTFTGKAATDWLMDCSTTVDRREAMQIANLFVEYDFIECIHSDRAYMAQFPGTHLFQPTKLSIYQLTARGKAIINGSQSRGRTSESATAGSSRAGVARDSNTQRLDKILNDAALRLLFRENLRDTHCEENLSFYIDVDEFVRTCRQAIKAATTDPNGNHIDSIKEIMAQAYGIYNAFLAPGSPCELNIDHQLRNNLATRMTKAVGQDVTMIDTLHEVMSLFEDAQNAVFKLMASDSVPKFLRNPKYEQTLKNYDFDTVTGGRDSHGRLAERSQSRSNRK